MMITWGDDPYVVKKLAEFIVVDVPSVYNIILGRPGLNLMEAQVNTFKNELTMNIRGFLHIIRGDVQQAQQCFMTAIFEDETAQYTKVKSPSIQEVEETRIEVASKIEDVPILGNKERIVRIGKHLNMNLKQGLLDIMGKYEHIFVWSATNLGSVPRSFAEHHLGIPPSIKPIVQKRRFFAKDRQEAIRKEVSDLLDAGIIRQVDFPT